MGVIFLQTPLPPVLGGSPGWKRNRLISGHGPAASRLAHSKLSLRESNAIDNPKLP